MSQDFRLIFIGGKGKGSNILLFYLALQNYSIHFIYFKEIIISNHNFLQKGNSLNKIEDFSATFKQIQFDWSTYLVFIVKMHMLFQILKINIVFFFKNYK